MAGNDDSYYSESTENDDYYRVLSGLNILRKGIGRYVKDEISKIHTDMIDILHPTCRHIASNNYICGDCKHRIKNVLTSNHRHGKHDFTQTSVEKCVNDVLEVALFYCDTINTEVREDFDSIGCNGVLSLLLNVKDIERRLNLVKPTDMEIFMEVKLTRRLCCMESRKVQNSNCIIANSYLLFLFSNACI